jgi:hypothetical protein
MSLNSKNTQHFAIGDKVWLDDRPTPSGRVIKTIDTRYERLYMIQWSDGDTDEYYDFQITKDRPEKDLTLINIDDD